MAEILNIKKFKEENREELDSILFMDLLEGFMLKEKELKRFNFDVKFDRNIGGRVIHQINPDWKMMRIIRKIQRSKNHRNIWNLEMRDINLDDINWVFGKQIELKNEFLNEIYYKYYV